MSTHDTADDAGELVLVEDYDKRLRKALKEKAEENNQSVEAEIHNIVAEMAMMGGDKLAKERLNMILAGEHEPRSHTREKLEGRLDVELMVPEDGTHGPTTMTVQIADEVNPKAVRDTLGEQYVMHEHAEDGIDYYVDEPRR